VLTLLRGHRLDSAVISGVVVLNAAIGFPQEGRAEHAMAAIRSPMDPRCHVLRGGLRVSLPAESLVVGDGMLPEAGERVPADLRLLQTHSLRIDEALLTGESIAGETSIERVANDSALVDRRCLSYSGSLVAIDSVRGLVVNTAVVLGIFSLFAVRFHESSSLTLTGLTGVAVATAAQFMVTCMPPLQVWFDTGAIPLGWGFAVVGAGVPLLLALELQKGLLRGLRSLRRRSG
jgi:P-type E1-E2 ATPase